MKPGLVAAAGLLALALAATAGGAAPRWARVPSADHGSDANYLSAVAALSSADAWSVGSFRDPATSQFQTLAEHWNGSSWSLTATPSPAPGYNELNAVAAVAADDVWAAGYGNAGPYGSERTLIEHWNGRRWTVVPSPSIGSNASILYGLGAVGANDVWAVGVGDSASIESGRPLVARWDGTAWTLVKTPSTGSPRAELLAVAEVSATNVWAVGDAGGAPLIEHWNGSRWRIVRGPAVTGGLTGVTALSPHNVWAVGQSGQMTLAEHWDGSSWVVVETPNGTLPATGLSGVAALGGHNVVAVGSTVDSLSADARGVSMRWDGTRWTMLATPNPSDEYDFVNGIAAVPGAAAFLAVGSAGESTLVLRS